MTEELHETPDEITGADDEGDPAPDAPASERSASGHDVATGEGVEGPGERARPATGSGGSAAESPESVTEEAAPAEDVDPSHESAAPAHHSATLRPTRSEERAGPAPAPATPPWPSADLPPSGIQAGRAAAAPEQVDDPSRSGTTPVRPAEAERAPSTPRPAPVMGAAAASAPPHGATAPARPARPAPVPPAAPGQRSIDGRLARIHLRSGLLTLARAELETMAGLETLDREALADLAEARWRSGDLVGGGEAARAHLEAGGSEPLAMVVAAEALAAEGRFAESRQLAARVVERAPGLLDRLFAGQARSLAWAELEAADADDPEIGTWGLLSGGDDVIRPSGRERLARPAADSRSTTPRERAGQAAGGARPTADAPHIAPRAAGRLTPPGVLGRIAPTDSPEPSEEGHPSLWTGRTQPGAAGSETEAGRGQGLDAGRGSPDASRGHAPDAGRGPGPGGDGTGQPTAAGTGQPAGASSQSTTPSARAVESGRIAGRELGAIEEAIARGEISSVASRLSLLLRLDRALAPVILSLADRALEHAAADDTSSASLHLVRGDAYRTLGREADATAAFDRSRLVLDASATDEEPM